MPSQKKVDKVEELRGKLEGSSVVLFADYRGLRTSEIEQLRRQLRRSQIDFYVAKNTLTRIALSKLGIKEVNSLLQGPTAVALGAEDEIKTAKVLVDYVKDSRGPLRIKGGLAKARLLSQADVQFLAGLSSAQEIKARVVGVMVSPLRNLVYIVASPLRGLVTVLQGRIQKMEGGSYAQS